MKRHWLVCACLILCLAAPVAAGQTPPWRGVVLDVLDGDSLIIRRGRHPYEIRLYGIDAPEYNQPWGQAAKRRTMRLKGKRVKVHAIDFDRHKRMIAKITTPDGEDLGLELIRAGLAWWYKRYSPNETAYKNAQRQARHAKRGLWAEPNPIPPWKWRRGKAK
jgi:micrococcal nuclease